MTNPALDITADDERRSAEMVMPFRGPRAGHVGEQAFCDRWAQFVRYGDDDGEYSPIERALGGMRPDLRRCRVAASLICWLGTNVGLSYLGEGRRLRDQKVRWPFFIAFSAANVRQMGVNHGLRLIETLLALDSDYGPGGFCGMTTIVRPIDYTVDDLEVLEAVTIWLGTDEGQRFIQESEAEIRRREMETRPARALLRPATS